MDIVKRKNVEPMRILHVLGSLNRGGAECLLMNIYKQVDRSLIQFDFMVHVDEKCEFEDEIRELGGNVYHCPSKYKSNIYAYWKWWQTFLDEHDEYYIVHGHMRSLASVYLYAAKKRGLFTIAHSHNTSSGNGIKATLKNILQYPIRYIADYYMACSNMAAEWLFGRKIVNSEKYHLLFNAIELNRFTRDESIRLQVRKELLLDNQIVIGNVGRFVQQKNHVFLLDIFSELHRCRKDIKLLLVGYGELEGIIKNKIKQLGLEDYVIIPEAHDNPSKYLQAMDVFVFPSLYEGLGIALIEAQAAGLPCVVSDVVPREAYVSKYISACSLDDSLQVWVNMIENYINSGVHNESNGLLELYDIKEVTDWISKFYFDIKVN